MSNSIIYVESTLNAIKSKQILYKGVKRTYVRDRDAIVGAVMTKLEEILVKYEMVPDTIINIKNRFSKFPNIEKENMILLGTIIAMHYKYGEVVIKTVMDDGTYNYRFKNINSTYDKVYPELDKLLTNPLNINPKYKVTIFSKNELRMNTSVTNDSNLLKETRKMDIIRYLRIHVEWLN